MQAIQQIIMTIWKQENVEINEYCGNHANISSDKIVDSKEIKQNLDIFSVIVEGRQSK